MRTARPYLPAEVEAWAKLTLSLHVTGVRDDGYHLLDAVMVTVSLRDTLYLSEGDGLEVVEDCLDPGGCGDVPAGPTNLVARALALAGRRARVRLVKRVPAGGGLGGGSADAAAVLRWAGFGDEDGPGDRVAAALAAARLGSDVPFCLLGEGYARVRGAGEVVEPLPWEAVAGGSYTLVIPPFGVPTAVVYRIWDELGGPTRPFNDLEPAALVAEPRLALWRDRLGEATGAEPRLAGSGSTWFVPGAFPGPGRVVVKAVRPWEG
jgi:4-diphosphocytidyl-2-C-methyl-D-erythritol kinase